MKKALEDKDKALADAQKVAKEKTQAAEKQLAAVGKVEEENTKLKQERADWNKNLERLTKRAKGLEKYLGDFAQKMYIYLEGNFLQSSEFH
jgi:DNA repair exonuclease SbcCD ATPase subunit